MKEEENYKRDRLWEAVFTLYYKSSFWELASDKIIAKWLLLDEITKVLIAVTASGSAVSGWALWEISGWKELWIVLAGVTALLSILHSTLNVSNRIRDWTEIKRNFSSLKNDLEGLRTEMSVNYDFSIEDLLKKNLEFNKLYGRFYTATKKDILLTKQFRLKIQNELDSTLTNQIIQDE